MGTPQSAAPMHALEEHRAALAGRTLTELFAADADRFSRLSLSWDQWLADWSKQRVTPQAIDALVAYAHERNLPAWISALFSGEKINLSEGRPVLHTALRQQDDTPLLVDGSDVIAQVRAAQARVRTLASQIRGGLRLGATGRPLRHVVAIGIGGSDLGPQARLRCAGAGAQQPRRRRRRRIRLQRRSRAPDARAGRARSGDDLVHRHVEDIHDRRNARQRACGARVAGAGAGRRRRARRALRRDHQQRRGGARVRRRGRRHTADLGLGRRPLFALVAGRTADRDSLRLGRVRGAPRRRGQRRPPFSRDAARTQSAGAAGAGRFLECAHARLSATHRRAVRRGAEAVAELSAAADAGKQRQVGAARRITGRRSDGAGALGRPRHRRPARLLPVAAPGHVDGSRRVHRAGARRPSARRAAGAAGRECAGAGAGPDARQVARRGASGSRARGEGRRASARPTRSPPVASVPATVRRRRCCCRSSMRGGWAS